MSAGHILTLDAWLLELQAATGDPAVAITWSFDERFDSEFSLRIQWRNHVGMQIQIPRAELVKARRQEDVLGEYMRDAIEEIRKLKV